MEDINEDQEVWANMMDDLISKTNESVEKYVDNVLKILVSKDLQLEEHFEGLTHFTDEKGSQFESIQEVKILNEKMSISQTKFKDIFDQLDTDEPCSFDQLKEFKEQIFKVIKKEKAQYEQSYYLIHQLKKYLSLFQEIKESKIK